MMFTCGLYDHAGEWAYRVGLPAKSGVGGGILGIVNRQLGIAVYSPKLDAKGNSVRGILACKDLGERTGTARFRIYERRIAFHAINALMVSPTIKRVKKTKWRSQRKT